MKKYNIGGIEFITVKELRNVIKSLRRNIPVAYSNFSSDQQAMIHLAYNDVVKQLYRDELSKSESPDEIKAILEMPGDFIVCKRVGKHEVMHFTGWNGHGADFSSNVADALYFDYESKAEEVAEQLGDEWHVVDMSDEEFDDNKRLMRALFGDDVFNKIN